ncbi:MULTISPECIES: hypothetical protein [unclassified Streptomyces]|uniref:hypothetical protein n=1 Tax=unclassified Streptomyces TaxID=2593676 RepID=UPI000965A5C1|nr:hypothetical protein [Streptomyces sp. TSRI0281]OKI43404.1 hypothetical protein A6A29_08720 [Streptomyces sp. TSRI0281]
MRTLTGIRRRTGAFRARAGAALAVLVLLGSAGTTVAAGPSTVSSATATTAPTGRFAEGATQPERLAEELRRNPVYVSADRPRRLPRSLAPDIAALAERTGVPTYVLALPAGDATLLALVRDRLGEDGLYVLIGDHSSISASAFGVDVPDEEACRIALYGTPYGAGPLAAFESFVDAIASGRDRAAAKADELYDRYHKNGKPDLYISSTDRQNQNLLLGLAVVVIPGLVLALGIRLSRRRSQSAGKKKSAVPTKPPAVTLAKGSGEGSGKAAAKPKAPARTTWFPARRRGVLPVTTMAAVAAAVAVVLAAPTVFPQTVDRPDLSVTQGDLDARVEEVAAGLAAGPVYQDPSTADLLTGADLPAIRQRIADLAPKGPVHVLVTPTDGDDESGGDRSILLARVHQRTGQNGVYVLIDPVSGRIDLDTFGTDQDAARRFRGLPSTVLYPEYRSDGDLRVVPRLNRTLDAVAAARPSEGDDPANRDAGLPPLRDNRLPGLFTSDFGPGIMLGTMLLGTLLLIAWLGIVITRAVLRSLRTRAADPSPSPAGPRHATALPSVRQLRAWAATDVRELTGRLAAVGQEAPGRARAWDCLDAAELLAGSGSGSGDRCPDEAAEAGRLAAVLVLAQAGLAALQGHLHPTLCRLNPLHGEATGGRVPGWLVDLGVGPRSTRLCPACRDALRRSGANRSTAGPATREREVTERLLRLPAADSRTRTAWDEAGQVLPAAREGLETLILRARESASVQ